MKGKHSPTHIIWLSVFLFASTFLQAQNIKLSDSPADLISDINKIMSASKMTDVLSATKNLETVWGSINEAQQKKIHGISKKMAVRHYKLSEYGKLYEAIYQAIHTQAIAAADLDKFLFTTENIVEKYDQKQSGRYFDFITPFFEKRLLYNSKSYRLYATGGTFNFDIKGYVPPDTTQKIKPAKKDSVKNNKTNTTKNEKKVVKYDKNGWPIDDDTPPVKQEKKVVKYDKNGWPIDDNTTTTPETVKKEKKVIKYDKDGWPIADDADVNNITIDTNYNNNNNNNSTYYKPLQPQVNGEILSFKNTSFVFVTVSDSLTVENTSGDLMIKTYTFVGNGGKVNWSSLGLPDVTADLKEYNFDIRNARLHAEDVTFNYPEKLEKSIVGIFDYVGNPHKSIKDANFPRFTSLDNNAVLKNPGDNLHYKGGFTLAGTRVFSASYLNKFSTLKYIAENETKFKLTSRNFELGDSLITSPNTAAVFYKKFAQQDSIIYHPSVRLKYNKSQHLLTLYRQESGFRAAPYVNTYHKVDMRVDLLQWYLDSARIDLSMTRARDSIPAVFESHDYFNETRYTDLKGIYKFHPLQLLATYIKAKNLPTDKFPVIQVEELAALYKLNATTVRGAMMEIAEKGYIDFDPVTGLITVFPKTTHNVAAYNALKDYDNFSIPSYTRLKPNATYDLNSNILTVRGITEFSVRSANDTRNKKSAVTIRPNRDSKSREDREIQLLQGRNFVLSTDQASEVRIGGNRWVGKGFIFNYDEFALDMREIDSVLFSKKDTVVDKNGVKKITRTEYGGDIKYKPGKVNIDNVNNKSGAKGEEGYPKFDAEGGGVIYFNERNRLRSTYGDSVMLVIPNVRQENLDKAQPTFIGVLKTNGLLPDIPNIKLEYYNQFPGFTHSPPAEGYPIYKAQNKGKAKMRFTGKLIMDKDGLHAPGQIDFLSTTIKSDNFLLTPDSVVAKGSVAEIREAAFADAQFPKVVIKDYRMKWLARRDSLELFNVSEPFELYKGSSIVKGSVIVTSKGLYGTGRLTRKDCEILDSPGYKFDKEKFTAKDAEFHIFSTNPTKPVLLANFVNINFDLTKGLVNLKSSTDPKFSGFSSLEFPFASYRTSINQANWDINRKIIGMNGDVKTSTFSSLDASGQEDLKFNASLAVYFIEKLTLNIGGIPFIKTADAKIIPRGGSIIVEENAQMREMSKAQVVIDTAHQFHKFFDGNIRILSKDKFEGNATLQYHNPDGQVFNVKFGDFTLVEEEIKTGKKGVIRRKFTTATGVVNQDEIFRLSSRLLFNGTIIMKAPDSSLSMDGFIKLDLKSRPDWGKWIAYKGGDKNITIQVDDNLLGEGQKLTAGLFIDKATSELYPTFVSEKRAPDDVEVFSGNGRLNYNPESNEFTISQVEKAAGVTYSGHRIVLNDSLGKVNFEGKINLTNNVPADYFISSGAGEYNLKNKNFLLNSFLLLNFPMNQQIPVSMGTRILDTKANEAGFLKEANEDKEKLFIKLSEIIGERAVKDYKEKLAADYTPLYEASKKLVAPMVISNVNLKWSEANNSFYSVGKIGISNIGATDLNAGYNGMVEIKKNPNGDEINVLLDITSELWYYLSYRQGQLGIISSDDEFNSLVSSKTGKVKPNQYAAIAINADEKVAFVDRFKSTYGADGKKLDTKDSKKTKDPTDKKNGF